MTSTDVHTTPRSADEQNVIAAAVATISAPKAAPADSFVLHAPLELLARVGLLPFVDQARRAIAVDRIAQLTAAYVSAGDSVDPSAERSYVSLAQAADAIADGIASADAAAVDAATVWLGAQRDQALARRLLAPLIVESLAAAGHAPIGLHLLAEVGPYRVSLLRGALRSITLRHDWVVDWHRQPVAPVGTVPASMAAALSSVPHLGIPGSSFIHPLVSQVQDAGLAAELLGPVVGGDVDRDLHLELGRRAITRVAAWSMLHDDPDHAPYGWTHCLTIPQAVLSLDDVGVDARTALAVAGTYVVAFRAALGIDPVGPLDDAAGGFAQPVPPFEELATFAALHHDAHLVKYTLASAHAARDDPAWAGTYLGAASYLADWWRAHPDASV